MLIHFALTITLFLFCLAVIYGAACDVQTFTIPNRVSYGLVGLFVVYAFLVWLNPPEIYFPQLHKGEFHITPIAMNVLYGLVVFAFFFVFWRLGWVGGGDVKFVSAISLFMGLDHVLIFVVLMSVISLLMVFILKSLPNLSLLYIKRPLPHIILNLIAKVEQRTIPYGLPAAMAALIVIPSVMSSNY